MSLRATRPVLALLVVVVSVGAIVTLTAGGGAAAPQVTARDAGPAPTKGGQFRFVSGCGFSHRAPDDPIVTPGKRGASHMHDFFGNRTTGADSTPASLQGQATSCHREGATSAYWVPTLYKDGRPANPRLALAYYYGAPDKKPETVRPHPPGLRMIAGDPQATKPQDTRIVHWDCGADSRITYRAEVPFCPEGYGVRMLVRFPDCWDGRRLDSPDHRAHVSYWVAGSGCPRSHPVLMPQILLKVSWFPLRGGPGIRLASGSAFSGHADFFSAWDPEVVSQLVSECINNGPVPARSRPCDKARAASS